MASLIDNQFARGGTILPDAEGITVAVAADHHWIREKREAERAFLRRVRVEAKAEGYTAVMLHGAINTD